MPVTGIRNGVLGRMQSSTAGWFTLFDVPPGYAVLLKDLWAFNASSAPVQIAMYMSSSGLAVSIALVQLELAPGATHEWSGWTGLDAGDTVQVYAGAAGVNFWSAGALLPGATSPLESALHSGRSTNPPAVV